MQNLKPLAAQGARAGGLRGAVSGRGSVLSKDTSKQSISPLKKRVETVESKGKITNNDGSGDGETSPTKRRKDELESPTTKKDNRVSIINY